MFLLLFLLRAYLPPFSISFVISYIFFFRSTSNLDYLFILFHYTFSFLPSMILCLFSPCSLISDYLLLYFIFISVRYFFHPPFAYYTCAYIYVCTQTHICIYVHYKYISLGQRKAIIICTIYCCQYLILHTYILYSKNIIQNYILP